MKVLRSLSANILGVYISAYFAASHKYFILKIDILPMFFILRQCHKKLCNADVTMTSPFSVFSRSFGRNYLYFFDKIIAIYHSLHDLLKSIIDAKDYFMSVRQLLDGSKLFVIPF